MVATRPEKRPLRLLLAKPALASVWKAGVSEPCPGHGRARPPPGEAPRPRHDRGAHRQPGVQRRRSGEAARRLSKLPRRGLGTNPRPHASAVGESAGILPEVPGPDHVRHRSVVAAISDA